MKSFNNLKTDDLLKIAVERNEGEILNSGVLCTYTGAHTGRSPKGKVIVKDDLTEKLVDWNNNDSISTKEFNVLRAQFESHKTRTTVFSQDVYAVRDKKYAMNLRVFTEYAKHSLFTRNMFIPVADPNFSHDWKILHFPTLLDKPTIAISFTEKTILISGTMYSGEIKKSVFTVLNFLFPVNHLSLPMHCSVNVDKDRQNPAIFFGLSGTGKTTLSSEAERILIGDDEHAWTTEGLTNFEGGCYAKTIRLSKKDEPQIWNACHKKGTIFENVVVKSGNPDFDDAKYTENARASYPTSLIDNADDLGFVDCHPENIIMLTCDAFGVLPAVCKLSADEAVEQFLIGYTAKVAGTEKGVSEPQATFSPCFGLPFMPLKPAVYAEILKEKIKNHNVNCWLVNTGWSAGPYGIGKRMPIKITRSIIQGIHSGEMAKCPTIKHGLTGFSIPLYAKITSEYLIPEMTWPNRIDYLETLSTLQKKIEAYKLSNK